MPTTLFIESFSDTNLRERTNLTASAEVADNSIVVNSTEGYGTGDILYIGDLSRDGCEKAVVSSVPDATSINLTTPLKLAHSRFQPVTSVIGDKIKVYRAPNVDGTRPTLNQFASIVTRSIDPDQLSTYYSDALGDASFWYGVTYYNETSGSETDLGDSDFRRGDDFGHYASLTEIRKRAGFENNYNLSDDYLDLMRRKAETEINSSLANSYTTPFVAPIPDSVREYTIDLAVGFIWADQYGENSKKASEQLKDVRARTTSGSVTDAEGTSLAGGTVSFWPDESAPRAFVIGDRF